MSQVNKRDATEVGGGVGGEGNIEEDTNAMKRTEGSGTFCAN